MKVALKVHWSTVPKKGDELFGLNPTLSTETAEQRVALKMLRVECLLAYPDALDRWNAGERDVVFPAGTVRMRLRHKANTEPIPALLRGAWVRGHNEKLREASQGSSAAAGSPSTASNPLWP